MSEERSRIQPFSQEGGSVHLSLYTIAKWTFGVPVRAQDIGGYWKLGLRSKVSPTVAALLWT